jgi:pyridoxamine 5'-phosphate oxidase
MNDRIAALRRSYLMAVLDESTAGRDPMALFAEWMHAALDSEIDEANGMALATASPDGVPSVRIVLLRGFDERGFVFYTNYESAKGAHFAVNSKAEIAFWWRELERQVRIGGVVEKVSRTESAAYFATRPRGHQLGAWASPQSRRVENREELLRREAEIAARFPDEVPIPDHWGGYRVVPDHLEFWQGRANRLHDRFRFERQDGVWRGWRVAP